MEKWKSILLNENLTILKAIEIIDSSSQKIGLVVDETNKLLGTVTDGDIRRGILKGVNLEKPIKSIMNTQPVIAFANYNKEQILRLMKKKQLRHIPVVDSNKHVVGLEIMDDIIQGCRYDNWIVLMAGGLGSRLGNLTSQCPKPLIPVGGKPLLETIVENFRDSGFYKFFLSVNYKAEMIEEHFADGAGWDIEINYLRENKRLGTAGALSLLEEVPDKPIIVMNGDLLTKVNFQQLLDYHVQHNAMATMCVREYSFQVPYGVVCIENGNLIGIDEKPMHNFFVSAGIYVLNPEVLEMISPDAYYDMPELFKKMIEMGKVVSVFPIREYWLDIGHVSDYEKANGDFAEMFT